MADKKSKKKVVADYERLYNEACKIIEQREEKVQRLEMQLDLAYQEQEKMLDDMDGWLSKLSEALIATEGLTGVITIEDIEYNVDMISRIFNHKYKFKSEEH